MASSWATEVVPVPVEVERRSPLELPEQVTPAVAELAGAAREGLLTLAVGTGLPVLHAMLAADVARLVGPKGRHNPDRAAFAATDLLDQLAVKRMPVKLSTRRYRVGLEPSRHPGGAHRDEYLQVGSQQLGGG
jgi:putative transposase